MFVSSISMVTARSILSLSAALFKSLGSDSMTWHIFSNKKLTSLVNDGVAMLGLKTVSYSDIMWWMPKFVNVIDVEFAIVVTVVGRMVA